MPLSNFGILKGRPVQLRRAAEPSPHYHLQVYASGLMFRATINARSSDPNVSTNQDAALVQYLEKDISDKKIVKILKSYLSRDGLYWFAKHFEPQDGLVCCETEQEDIYRICKNKKYDYEKCKDKKCVRKGDFKKLLAIDYVKGQLLDMETDCFKPVPYDKLGEDNDLNEFFDKFFSPLLLDQNSKIYFFGQVWGPDPKVDDFFGHFPDIGIHDIHMNQGNPKGGGFELDNGEYQDGCIIAYFPRNEKRADVWKAIFLKFASQMVNNEIDFGPSSID